MDERTFMDTLECLKADYDRLTRENEKLTERKDFFYNKAASNDLELRQYRYREKMKIREKEEGVYWVKVFPQGTNSLVKKGLSDSGIGLLIRLSAFLEPDTGALIDGNGNYMNKAGFAKALGKDGSNFNKDFAKLVDIGAIKEGGRGKKGKIKATHYLINDIYLYNGINRANSTLKN